jgi:PleD family two-component response regulator
VSRDADAERATHVAERARLGVKALELTCLAPEGRTTICLAITSVADGDVADFAAAQELADAALYESKNAGRDRVTIHLPAAAD